MGVTVRCPQRFGHIVHFRWFVNGKVKEQKQVGFLFSYSEIYTFGDKTNIEKYILSILLYLIMSLKPEMSPQVGRPY